MFSNRIIVLVILALLFGTTSVSAVNTITLDPQSVSVSAESNSTVTIRVDELPVGLAGYQLRVTLTDPGIAEITAVSYPAWAKLSNSTGVPSDSVVMSGVDIDRQVGPGARDVVFGTFTIHGDSTGSTGFFLSDLQVDADGGAMIILAPSQGTVIQPLTTSPVISAAASPAVIQATTDGSSGGTGSATGSSFSSGSSGYVQSTPVIDTTVSNEAPVITSSTIATAPVQMKTTTTATTTAAQGTSPSQPLTLTTKGGIPIWGVGFISLLAVSIALLVFVRVKRI